MSAAPITIAGELATVTFNRFDLDHYRLFLRAKALPESQVEYEFETDTYRLTTPARFAARLGVEEAPATRAMLPLADYLFDYQRWAVGMALEAKRFALWLDTGLGKTACFLEWARQVHVMTSGRVLIVAPLQIIPQIIEMASEFYGDGLPLSQLATRDDLIAWCSGSMSERPSIALVNYEKFIPGTISELRLLAGLVCDESSVLRTGGGVIKWNLIKSARGIEYKLSCTATPAPNEVMEYASQAAFLEKLRSEGDILWTYFQRDKRGEWTVKPHARAAFYQFMASWSVYLRDPAAFRFRDILAGLPEPEIVTEKIPITDAQQAMLSETLTRNGVGLWADERVSVTVRQKLLQIARGFRYVGKGKDRRVERVHAYKPEVVAQRAVDEVAAGRRVLIWTTFDEESEVLGELLDDVVDGYRFNYAVLHGKHSIEERVRILNDFRAGKINVLISKPQLVGYGLNLQFVRSMIFSGFDDSFERMYQSIRRAYRYGQTETVRVFVPYVPELEGMVFDNLQRKEARFQQEVAAQEEQYRIALGMGAA